MMLLGLHWGQFPEAWEIGEGRSDRTETLNPSLITSGRYVQGMSGMTCVIPAGAILEVLKLPELAAIHRGTEKNLLRQSRRQDAPGAETQNTAMPAGASDPEEGLGSRILRR